MGQSPEPYPPKVKRETDWLGGMSIALKCQDAGTSRNFQHPLGETLGCLVTFFTRPLRCRSILEESTQINLLHDSN